MNVPTCRWSSPGVRYIWLPTSVVGKAIDKEAIQAVRRPRNDGLLAIESIRPGVEPWLETARALGLKVGIASSSTSEWVEGHLSRLGIRDRFDCLLCRDQVQKTKPDPELYIAALSALGVGSQEAIAIEDSPNGIMAAKAAGLICVAVPNLVTAPLDLSLADYILDSLEESSLENLLTRIAFHST